MKYALTNARMINDIMLAYDMHDESGKLAGYIFVGQMTQSAEAAQWDCPAPDVVASRAFAAARALRFLKRSNAWGMFVRNNLLDASVTVNVPTAAYLADCEKRK